MLDPHVIGARVKQLRRAAGLRQSDLGAAVGLARSTIASIEGGHDQPGGNSLAVIANFFDKSLDWLTSKHGDQIKDDHARAQNEQEAMVLYAWRRLPPDEAEGLLKLLYRSVAPKGD